MDQTTASASFWETHYAGLDAQWGTAPNEVLVNLVTSLAVTPGTALDLGSGHGGDALWLASRGWNVTAVDVSATALSRVTAGAEALGLTDNVRTSRHDLAQTLPAGSFDLVSACYFHTPVDIPRDQVLRQAARAVAPGGLLVIVEHASVAPWSWQVGEDVRFPTPAEVLDALELSADWHTEQCDAPQRSATGPHGQQATVTENVIAVRRAR